jgi:hypothetical protein
MIKTIVGRKRDEETMNRMKEEGKKGQKIQDGRKES